MTQEAQLKACPFCGEIMYLTCGQNFAGQLSWWQVECGCGASHACEQTEAEAIAAWNTRTPDSVIAELKAFKGAAWEALVYIAEASDCELSRKAAAEVIAAENSQAALAKLEASK